MTRVYRNGYAPSGVNDGKPLHPSGSKEWASGQAALKVMQLLQERTENPPVSAGGWARVRSWMCNSRR